jgi:HEAT repeats
MRPEISRDSVIYRMSKKQTDAVLLTTLAPLILAVTCTLAVLRWGAPLPIIALAVLLWVPVILGYYLYATRSINIYLHSFVKKFLAFDDPGRLIAQFNGEKRGEPEGKFGNGFITGSFVVADLPYRFKWAYKSEIVWAYLRHPRFSAIVIPPLNPYRISIYLASGDRLEISGGNRDAAENFYRLLKDVAPFARFGDTQETRDLWLVDRKSLVSAAAYKMREMTAIEGRSDSTPDDGQRGSTADVARIVARLERVNVLVRDKDEEHKKQINNLNLALEKNDFRRSADLIDLMGDTQNTEAMGLLISLLDNPEATVKAHAALTLGKLGERSAVERLIRLLENDSAQVRENAAMALGMIGDNRAELPLRTMSAGNADVKRAAIRALSLIEKGKR